MCIRDRYIKRRNYSKSTHHKKTKAHSAQVGICRITIYSMWWMIIQHDWYVHTGDMEFLKRQMPYYKGLYQQLSTFIDESGKDCTPEPRFVDWPTADNKEAIDAEIGRAHV